MELIDASGIDEDGDGTLTKEEFLSFLRGLFLADIPSKKVKCLREAYDKAVAVAPDKPMDDVRVGALFRELGFDMKSSNIGDVIGVIDADNDGDVDFDEFLTGIGMMKKMTLLSKQLDTVFSNYMSQSNAAIKENNRQTKTGSETGSNSNRPSLLASGKNTLLTKYTSTRNILQAQAEEEEDAVELDASHLMAFLNVERDVAEEMVFLADQDEVEMERIDVVKELTGVNLNCYRSIDRLEFQQLIRNWS